MPLDEWPHGHRGSSPRFRTSLLNTEETGVTGPQLSNVCPPIEVERLVTVEESVQAPGCALLHVGQHMGVDVQGDVGSLVPEAFRDYEHRLTGLQEQRGARVT